MSDEKDFQEKFLTSSITSIDFVGLPGPLSVSGAFDSGTVTLALTGDVVAIDTFTADEGVFANATRITLSMSGASGSENVSCKWYPARVPY